MKILFQPSHGYIVLEMPEEDTKPKIHLSKELREKVIMEKTITWKVAATDGICQYKVGDEVILHPDSKNNSMKIPLPTTNGIVPFLQTTVDNVIGKVIKEDVTV